MFNIPMQNGNDGIKQWDHHDHAQDIFESFLTVRILKILSMDEKRGNQWINFYR